MLDTRRDLHAGALASKGSAFRLMSVTEADILGVIVLHELIHLLLPDEKHGSGLFKATLDVRDWLGIAMGRAQLDRALTARLGRVAHESMNRTIVDRRATAAQK